MPDRDTFHAGDFLLGRNQLGIYRIESILGQGGMGVVFRARTPDGGLVALKAIRPSALEPAVRARFEREAGIRIDHPNIVRTLDAGVDADVPYIAFELLAGASLEQRIAAAGRLEPNLVVGLLLQACAGLEAAHGLGIVHRDLKPANMFVCRDGTLKILDFGIAHVAAASRLTADATVLGTLAYLSPEQAHGRRDIDARSDLWSLGVVAYEALSGRLPFERETAIATLLAIIQDDPAPIKQFAPETPPWLVRIVLRCLARDRNERWPTVDGLASALESDRDDSVTRAPARPSLRPGRARALVVLLARGAGDAAAIERAISTGGGSAIRLLGDDVIGLFGAEAWRGDEAAQAASVAIEVRHLAVRVGLASGLAYADAHGLAGRAVVAAQRASEADLEGVGVDPEMAPLLGSSFVVEEAPGGFFELLAARGADADLVRAEQGPLVARTAEVDLLRRAIEAALTGPAIVVLSGPAGIGKTRLRQEADRLFSEHRTNGIALFARGESMQRQTRFGLFAAALRRHARLRAATAGWPPLTVDAPPLARRQAVIALVREAIAHRDEAISCAEVLGDLLGVPWGASAALREAREDPELMADRIRVALRDYAMALARRQPVALIFEDLQWADPESIVMVEGLRASVPSLPFFALLTSRGEVTEIRTDASVVRCALTGLDATGTRVLAERAMGHPLTTTRLDALQARTEGNPLFVEQIAAAIGEGTGPEAELPFTVEAALQTRLDELPDDAREACRVASVFGRAVQVGDLEALGVPRPHESIALLGRRDLIESQVGGGTSGHVEHRLRSSLLLAVAYRTIPEELCRDMHRRVATHLERQAAADPEEVATHLERAGLSTEAAARYTAAVRDAAVRGDAERVIRCSDRALALGPPEALRFAIHMARADAFRYLRRRPEQAVELGRALGTAAGPAERARALIEQVILASRAGEHEVAARLAGEAIREADAGGDVEAQASCRARYAHALALAGEQDAAATWIAGASAIGAQGTRIRGFIAGVAATVASGRGDLGGVLTLGALAARLASEAGDLRRAAAWEGNLADAYNRIGAYEEAEAALHKALDGCRRVGNHIYEGYVLLNLGYAYARRGKTEDALNVLGGAERIAAEARDARLAAAVPLYRARALAAAGRLSQAFAEGERASSAARVACHRPLEATAEAFLARIALRLDRLDDASARSARAVSIRDEIGAVGEDEAEIFVARVEALRAAGQLVEAEAVRALGAATLRRMGAGLTDPAWRASFERGVEEHRILLSATPLDHDHDRGRQSGSPSGSA